MIIDNIIKFLQYDVGKFFNNSNCCLCCLKLSVPFKSSEKNCITHKYEPRPKITDGDAEDCDCETTATTETDADTGTIVCGDAEPECQPECPEGTKKSLQSNQLSTCQMVCQRIIQLITSKCSSATVAELDSIEDRACELWQTLNSSTNSCNNKYPNWWDLKSWQRLPFYWAALSNEILCEEPAENFKRFYLGNSNPGSKSATKKQNERALILWHSLNPKQRLPFIVEAFISKVAAGKVNLHDEHEIQRVIGELLRY